MAYQLNIKPWTAISTVFMKLSAKNSTGIYSGKNFLTKKIRIVTKILWYKQQVAVFA